jgi:hypothetical protein
MERCTAEDHSILAQLSQAQLSLSRIPWKNMAMTPIEDAGVDETSGNGRYFCKAKLPTIIWSAD